MVKCKLALLFFLLFTGEYSRAQVSSAVSWPSYRGDPQLTGISRARITPPFRLIWTFKTGDAVKSSPAIYGNTIFAGSSDGYLYALDMNGRLKWKFNAGNSIEAPVLVVDPQKLKKDLNPAAGEKHQTSADRNNSRQGNTAIRDSVHVMVVASTLEGNVFAVEASGGKMIWKYSADGQINGSANIAMGPGADSLRLVIGSYDNFLHCLDAATGKLLWKYETGNYINGTPAMFGKLAIFGGCDGFLRMINTGNGEEVDKISTGTYMASSPAVGKDKTWFGNYDGEFFCLDLRQKKILWKTGGGGSFLSSPAIAGKRILAGAQNKYLYCFNAGTGELLWKYQARGKVDASPVVTGNQVIFASGDGWLRILDSETGKEIWSYELGPAIYSTPAVISNCIVTGADDGTINLFGK